MTTMGNAERQTAEGLPAFIEAGPDGVHVDTARLPSAAEFESFVDGVFAAGRCFGGLDYHVFQRILYDFDLLRTVDRLRLARDIREFPPARRALYRGLKVAGDEAGYLFEPLLLEGAEGGPPEKASLDPDEFVAALWAKGVRCGIDLAVVRLAIQEGRCERLVVAREQPSMPGRDADLQEQTPELHRDNAPRELANGRVDLGQFQNRFPQIKGGTRLLMKTPAREGIPGRSLDGKPVAPAAPRDFDLSTLAGEGTRIETEGGSQYIVAVMDGFLSLDSKTNRIAITEKIVNRDGVSARTTGNLALAGDEYEEFGEVQEGRVVEGKGLTFHANVFGKVLSAGGDVVLQQNLVGGTAQNRSGSITVLGLASNALVQTAHGGLVLKRAENSVLLGDRVEVEWAANCTVLADEVSIGVAEGCAIGGKRIHIGAGDARAGQETLVSLLLPDLSGIAAEQEEARRHIGQCEAALADLQGAMERLAGHPEVHKYLALAGRIHRQEIALTPEQQAHWQQLGLRLGPLLKQIARAREESKAQEGEIAAARQRIADLAAAQEKAMAALACRIDSVQGEMVVRTLPQSGAAPLASLPPRELKQRLGAPDAGGERLFAGSSGDFAWPPG